MLKKISCLMLAAVMLTAFVSCQRRPVNPGGSSNTSQNPASGSTENIFNVQKGVQIMNYNVVIYPDVLSATGENDAATLAGFLTSNGFSAKVVDQRFIANGKLLSESDCLIMMNARYAEASLKEQLGVFFCSSKDAVLLGGKAFSGTIEADRSIKSLKNTDEDQYADYRNLFTLPIYDAADQFVLEDIVCVDVASGSGNDRTIDGKYAVTGSFSGMSAIGVKETGKSWFYPLLEARDAHNRARGWAAGTLVYYSGAQTGAQITLYGINENSYYLSDGFKQSLDHILRVMSSGRMPKNASDLYVKTSAEVAAGDAKPRRVVLKNGLFCYEDGSPFNLIGTNLCGISGFDNFYRNTGDYQVMEMAFKRMNDAGINAVRLWGWRTDHGYITNLKACARKYGVYLLPVVTGNQNEWEKMNETQLKAKGAEVAELFKDEPMLLGYDLFNEPGVHQFAKLIDNSGEMLITKYPIPDFSRYQEYANMALGNNRKYEAHFFSFPDVNSLLKPPSHDQRLLDSYNNANKIISTAISWVKEGVRSKDATSPVTVGFFNAQSMLPGAGEHIDFISNHIYDGEEAQYETITDDLKTFDRLQTAWPGKPIVCGEFAMANGYFRSKMRSDGTMVGDGTAMDRYSTGISEACYYIYAYANRFGGAMKWYICDLTYYSSLTYQTWLDTDADRVFQANIGLYYYDGTIEGKPKPIAFVTSFLRDIMDENLALGSFKLFKDTSAGNRASTGFEYIADRCYMAGGSNYSTARVSFTTPNGKPSVFQSYKKGADLVLQASNDTNLTLDTKSFGLNSAGNVMVQGKFSKAEERSGKLYIEMLEGERLVITNK